jgi:DeoR/GlpR family transcriptional regulator of sugar metabolism
MLVYDRFTQPSKDRQMQRTRQDAMDGLLPDEREQLILERLRTQGRVLASEIAAELNTSAGLCKRVYGGALLTSPSHLNASTRMKADVDRKQRLAIAAASIVQPGQVILLDAGSTNVAIAQALPDNAGLTVVTNSPEACLRLLDRPGFDIVLIGGRVGGDVAGALGSTALLQVQQIKADVCFLGACALDPVEGIAAFNAEDAELKRAMLKSSSVLAIAMTTEKLMTAAPFVVGPASAIDCLIVEADLAADRISELEEVCDNVMVATS